MNLLNRSLMAALALAFAAGPSTAHAQCVVTERSDIFASSLSIAGDAIDGFVSSAAGMWAGCNGINTTSIERPVAFDFEGSGNPEPTAWTDPTTEEAFLVLDLNANGRIDSGLELFGNSTRLPSGAPAQHGFEALAVYDDWRQGGNGDGKVTAADRIWKDLALWVDRNHNGRSEANEILPVRASKLTSLDLNFVESLWFDGNVNWHRYLTTYTRRCNSRSCHTAGLLEDVFFYQGR